MAGALGFLGSLWAGAPLHPTCPSGSTWGCFGLNGNQSCCEQDVLDDHEASGDIFVAVLGVDSGSWVTGLS